MALEHIVADLVSAAEGVVESGHASRVRQFSGRRHYRSAAVSVDADTWDVPSVLRAD